MDNLPSSFSSYLLSAGAVYGNFHKEELTPILKEIEQIKKDFSKTTTANKMLVGNIEREFILSDSIKYLQSIMMPYIKEHLDIFGSPDYMLTKSVPLELAVAWVNFQKKYEFNPIHNHEGMYSFILWVDVPFTNEEEDALPHSNYSRAPSSGAVNFVVPALSGIKVITIRPDKKWNYSCVLFKSELWHEVYPFFSSDEYRISISGNFVFNTGE